MTFEEIKNLPAGEFKLYWNAALEKVSTEKGKEQKQLEVLEDEMTAG